jgi:NhaA family Na+:H+ antiporter
MADKTPDQRFPIAPPEASRGLIQIKRAMRAPVDAFLHHETAGGIILLAAAVVALIWANSPWGSSYRHLWHTPIGFTVGSFDFSMSLHHWINEGLMTIFFLVVGFEIKREIAEGELSDLKRASLPVACAIGGMVVPALIYFALNPSGPQSAGWGIPMATDIAFALGILMLLGKRVPAAMRILLLALAIIDDLGAILVIAIFYTPSVDITGLYVIGLGGVVMALFLAAGIRPGAAHLIPLVILWIGLYKTGVHATLSGVIVGLATPVKPWLSKENFLDTAGRAMDEFRRRSAEGAHRHELIEPINRLAFAGREALSPVVRGESQMHGLVAFGIMPLFALANAGVNLGGIDMTGAAAGSVMLGVAGGLVVGKPLGVLLAAWLAVKLKIAALPRGLGFSSILVVGLAAGIGFTMSIFIAELAFATSPELLGLAKLAILAGTGVAAFLGLGIGIYSLGKVDPEIARLSAAEVEKSTEY